MDPVIAKQIFYLVGIVVVMFFAMRVMKKVKPMSTEDEEMEEDIEALDDENLIDTMDEESADSLMEENGKNETPRV